MPSIPVRAALCAALLATPLLVLAQELTQAVDFAEVFFISASTGDGVMPVRWVE